MPQERTTLETYLGSHYREANLFGESVTADMMTNYQPTSTLPQDAFAFGGPWPVSTEGATAGPGATLALQFQARDV
jgi:hypothetical protein